ncbi:MAG: signal recognition particle receptor subunit alpha, partial [Methyloligellaceae bacterium]
MSDTNEKKGSFFDRFKKKTGDPAVTVTEAEAVSSLGDQQDDDPRSDETFSKENTQEDVSQKDVPQEGGTQEGGTQEEESQPDQKQSWFQRLKSGLSKSSSKLTEGLTSIFTHKKLDDETLQSLEDLLIQADLGVDTAVQIT